MPRCANVRRLFLEFLEFLEFGAILFLEISEFSEFLEFLEFLEFVAFFFWKHPEQRLLDQAQVLTPYDPPFLGSFA